MAFGEDVGIDVNAIDRKADNVRAEYSSLEDRYARTIERRDKYIEITLTFTGVLLGGAIAHQTIPSIALIYPPIAVFLASAWVNSYIITILITKYIREFIRCEMPNIGWEIYLKCWRDQKQGSSRIFAIPGGLFVSSQILAILVGIIITPVPIESNIADTRVQFLLLLDILCVLVTAWYLNKAVYDKEFIKFDVGDALK